MFQWLTMTKKAGAKASEIAVALADAEAELKASREKREALAAERVDVLLAGDDGALDAHERKITDAGRTIERIEAVLPALRERLAEARAAEAKTALDRRLAEAEKAAGRGVDAIARYGELARQMVAVLGELQGLTDVVENANALAKAAGDPRRVATPNARARGKAAVTVPAHEREVGGKMAWDEKSGTGLSAFKPRIAHGGAVAGGVTPERTVTVPEATVPGFEMRPLTETVVLPSAGAALENLWPVGAPVAGATELRQRVSEHGRAAAAVEAAA